MWSWILPIVGAVYTFGLFFIFFSYSPKSPISTTFFIMFDLLPILFFITGLFLGIFSLIRIKHNQKLTGRADAIVGIILNSIVIFWMIPSILKIMENLPD